MEIIEEPETPKALIWGRRVGLTLLALHSLLCISIAIDILRGSSEASAWWPILTFVIDFPISILFTHGGIEELVLISIFAGFWHFYWPQWLVRIYLCLRRKP